MNDFVVYYVIVYLSITIHEISHFVFGVMIGLKSNRCYIGEQLYRIRLSKVYISPLAFGGYNECEIEEMKLKNIKEIILFYLAGIFGNLIMIVLGFIFLYQYIVIILLINISMIAISLLPIPINNDYNSLVKTIKYKNNV